SIAGPLPTTAAIRSHDWNDAYDSAWRIQGEIGYVLTRHLEVFGLFRYEHAEGDGRTSGSHVIINDAPIFFEDVPLNTKFDDYNSYGGELGFRYFFRAKEAALRPYVSI